MARPKLKSIQDLANKKIGVTNLTSVDHVTAEEMLRNKGMNLGAVTFLGLGNEGLRIQALRAGAIDAIAIAPPHHLSLISLGFNALAGPQDVQRARPLSGIAVANRLFKEKPQAIKSLNRALLKSHRFIFENKSKNLRSDDEVAAAITGSGGGILRSVAAHPQPQRGDQRRRMGNAEHKAKNRTGRAGLRALAPGAERAGN